MLVQVAQELDVEIDEMKNFFLTTDISGDPVNPSLNKENIKQAYLFFKHSNLSNSSINDINLLTVYNRLNDEGQRKVCGYATDLDNSGNYRKESVKSSNSEAG